ncbi:unnamed protein product [Miscanthus lutarioriparius]|uniref:Rad51-like C-terminal domain-containing protein n=1 Tax=Miscanthus lutarioriparius TaxID=422564 RepID=A0A811RF56_9POAL|nr:unnamed protein product [Miscanthus lutarioriparius]
MKFSADLNTYIAERFGMDASVVLDNLIYPPAYTYEHQYNLLLGLAAKMAEGPFRLLLAQMLSHLTKVAEEFNVAVYITNQASNPHAGRRKVAYIDTEGTLYLWNFINLVLTPMSTSTFFLLGLAAKMAEEPFRLLRHETLRAHMVFLSSWKQIVDSVIALFRVDFSGRGELAERQQKQFNVAVYITNQGGLCYLAVYQFQEFKDQ